MKTYKQIAHAYPTSHNAKKLGFYKTGCYYIELTHHNIEQSGQSNSFIPHDMTGFSDKHDPDLISLLSEYSFDLHPDAVRLANKDIDQAWRIGKTKEQMIKDQLIEKAGINKSWADSHIEIIMG